MKLEIRSLKSHVGHNGIAWVGTLWCDGRPVARVEDRGDGGGLWWDWTASDGTVRPGPTAARCVAHAASLPPLRDEYWRPEAEMGPRMDATSDERAALPMNLDLLAALLADEAAASTRAKRRSRKIRTVGGAL